MTIRGKDQPIARLYEHESGEGFVLRVDFRLYPAGWVEIHLSHEELKRMEEGQVLKAEDSQ